MKKNIFFVLWLIAFLRLVSVPPILASDLTLMTHDSFDVSKDVVAAFESKHSLTVKIFKAGDAGAALNKAILSKRNPLADVFFGVDNTYLSRALDAGIFQPYHSPQLSHIDDALKLDPEFRLLPVDFGDVCLNYDKEWFRTHNLAPPKGLEDLVKPAYAGLTVVENPATSSPGLAFLLATIGYFGEDGYITFWKQLRNNKVLVVDGWEKAYWGHFSAASDGDRPLVVSYASSPPAEVHYAKVKPDEAPTAAVVSKGSCFRQIEFIGILTGTKNRKAAEALIDFMLDTPFQEDIPLKMFVFPANRKARVPELFVKHAAVAESPAEVPAEAIRNNRERWIEAWTDTVLR